MTIKSDQNIGEQFVADAFRCFRIWYIDPETYDICSLNGTNWMPGRIHKALCGRNRIHESPTQDCSCGIYARYDPFDLHDLMPKVRISRFNYETILIAGALDVFGRILHSERGVQGQYARITALTPVLALDGRITSNSSYYPIERHKHHVDESNGAIFYSDVIINVARKYRVRLYSNMHELTRDFPMENLDFLNHFKEDRNNADEIAFISTDSINYPKIESRLVSIYGAATLLPSELDAKSILKNLYGC